MASESGGIENLGPVVGNVDENLPEDGRQSNICSSVDKAIDILVNGK